MPEWHAAEPRATSAGIGHLPTIVVAVAVVQPQGSAWPGTGSGETGLSKEHFSNQVLILDWLRNYTEDTENTHHIMPGNFIQERFGHLMNHLDEDSFGRRLD